MTSDFSRVITLLRKERGITQKQAAADLGVSQALLSHYEKGIRECGLDFVVRVADYYEVSCDYLLGRSTDRNGLTLNVEDLLDSESRTDSKYRGSVVAVMKKKFITNSINVLYDKLIASRHEGLIGEVSTYLMMAVYRMFRMLYSSNSRNSKNLFRVSETVSSGYTSAAMLQAEANIQAMLAGENTAVGEGIKDTEVFFMTSESLSREAPLYSTSLFRVIKMCEDRILLPQGADAEQTR